MLVRRTRWTMEMGDRADLRPAAVPEVGVTVAQVGLASPEFSRFLMVAVGGPWHWTSRLDWAYQKWLDWLHRPEVGTWVAYVDGTPAGYVEVEAQADGATEIISFGLLRPFIGHGIGGHFLTEAVRRAWDMQDPTRRVWLHTNSLDGPHARANYEARGFRVVKEEVGERELPDEPPPPWPGANRPEGVFGDGPDRAD